MVDKQDEIYMAILRGISVKHPAHYRVLITSRLSNDEGETSGKIFMMASRMQTMYAETDVNMSRFLDIYRQSCAYLLLPAIFNGGVEPKLIPELAILKRELSVKNAIDVNEHDVEVMALGAEEYRRRFETSGPSNRS
ncbi:MULTISPECIES: hypothetical protein [Enterobacterales]|uniref:hypothetical protein n=1 Tax=Enterobacterales TaxID=91347 RepID=UPI0015EA3935|nr:MULTISPECIES: hypothetical protein [Enterobacterales]QMR74194.1 hypothetical protein HV107_00490 [Enterobacter sp. RHBSTW-00175]